MCGIAGFIQRQLPDPAIIERMTDSLSHRGPDGRGVFTQKRGEWHVSLGHRRLSIIDIAGGHQPLGNEDGSVQITFNGEIYNFQKLRDQLIVAGHRFTTHSDTEVIVHHFEQHGNAAVKDLDGMFAFGIWDSRRGELLLARDRIGIKPLYYAALPCGGIAFASELRALLQHHDVQRTIDRDALRCYFFCDYIQPPRTIFKNVYKLPPAHTISWHDGAISEANRFWSLPHDQHDISEDNAKSLLQDRLQEAVRAQLISDVPVGVFLSGGIDSSLVAAAAQRESTSKLKTFSIGFEDQRFDESQFARLAASHLGTEHVEQTYREADLLANLDDALNCLDEPMGDPSILPTFALSKLAAQHVKVVIGGDGGDELWAGYPTYRAARIAAKYARVPRVVRERVLSPLVGALPVSHGYQSFEWKARRFVHRWDDHPIRRHFRWMSSTDLPELDQLAGSGGLPAELLGAANGSADLNAILALDLQTYLPGSVLTKVDRASMAHSLEVRPPLLHTPLVDLAFSLPADMKLKGKISKYLLKRVAAEYLPEEIVHRKKKGFAIPLSHWIAGPLNERVAGLARSPALASLGVIDSVLISRWHEEHLSRRADRSKPLWALLVLEHWARTQLNS